MTDSFVQMEVSCSIGRLCVGKMTIDGCLCVLLAFQGLVYWCFLEIWTGFVVQWVQ